MDRDQIVKSLLPLVKTAFSDESIVISDDMCAADVAGWTSLSFMQLLSSVESTFGIKFKITELISVRDMGGLIAAIERHFQ